MTLPGVDDEGEDSDEDVGIVSAGDLRAHFKGKITNFETLD